MSESPLVLTVPQAAQRLSVSEAMIWRLLADGRLPSLKIGAARRVVAADLDAWIAEQAQLELAAV